MEIASIEGRAVPVSGVTSVTTTVGHQGVKFPLEEYGRVIRVGQNTKFYLYAVCDITTTLEQILDFHDFSQTPDKLGYYKYNDKMNAYIEILSYCDFPSEHWVKIRTNNVIERMNREIRRRTRVVGAFPDGNSALMLVCARLRHVAGTQWGSKK